VEGWDQEAVSDLTRTIGIKDLERKVCCTFNNVIYDESTIWPEGFDPSEHGNE
jgi:hypothetical protein